MNGITNPFLVRHIKKLNTISPNQSIIIKNKYKYKNKDAYDDFRIQPLHN